MNVLMWPPKNIYRWPERGKAVDHKFLSDKGILLSKLRGCHGLRIAAAHAANECNEVNRVLAMLLSIRKMFHQEG